MSNYRQLLLLCVKALSTFNPEVTGVDNHLESFQQSPESNLCDDADWTFVSEVFAGCVRYKTLIKLWEKSGRKTSEDLYVMWCHRDGTEAMVVYVSSWTVVVGGYYARDGKVCLRADANLYYVLAYLVMFRLEELGMGHFKRLVNTQHTGKMHKFLGFLFDKKNLKGWIRDEWCRVYDQSFVETNLMSPILRFDAEMEDFIQQLSDKLANRGQQRKQAKPVTDTQPFNLTRPRPRSVPTPERIPTLRVYRPVPKSTYVRPTEEEKLTHAFQSNRRKVEEVLQEADKMQFACASTEKSEKTKAIMEQIVTEREARLQYSPRKPTPTPASMKESRPVKLNMAAILREGARVQREEEEEEKRLASLEAGQRDASEFMKWQEEMKQKEAAEQLAEIERRHLEGQLSYEEAIIARRNLVRENREKVLLLKEESEELMQEYFSQREEEQREMRQLVEATMAGHQNARDAKLKLQHMKHKIVQQVSKESQELMARALEEAETEMRRKVELIQQIRAMESVPLIRTKFVDLTETAGQGLLSEMSVAELRERLSLLKVAEAEEEEKRRREILFAKQAKEQLLSETLENISRHRAEQNRQASLREEQQKQTFRKHHTDLNKDKKLSELQEKVAARRRERERLMLETPGVTQDPTRRSPSVGTKKGGRTDNYTFMKSRSALTGPLQPTSAITTLLRTANKSN